MDWQSIESAPRDGSVIEITAFEADGVTPFEIWPCQWGHIKTNPLFAPGQIGMWMLPDGSVTWREGDGGPTHWRQLRSPPTLDNGGGEG